MPLDSPTQVLAIRHGETDWNRVKRIQGHTDIALSELGLAQARLLGQALSELSVDALYASDLLRAQQTAQAVAAAQAGQQESPLRLDPLHLDPQLRERSFGCFEGLTWEQIKARWPSQSEQWRRRDADFGAEGGETLGDFYQRSVAALTRIAARHPGQTIVIVTHGGVLDCLYRAATGLSLQAPRTWTLGNAAINRLLYTHSGFRLVGWHDASHLEPLAEG